MIYRYSSPWEFP